MKVFFPEQFIHEYQILGCINQTAFGKLIGHNCKHCVVSPKHDLIHKIVTPSSSLN